MEPRINSQSDDEASGIDKRLDKLAEDIKKLPKDRVDTLERLVKTLTKLEESSAKASKKTIGIKEAATILGVSRDTIRRAITAGTIKAVRLSKQGNWLISLEEIERVLRGEV